MGVIVDLFITHGLISLLDNDVVKMSKRCLLLSLIKLDLDLTNLHYMHCEM